jgi:hypothetical protein
MRQGGSSEKMNRIREVEGERATHPSPSESKRTQRIIIEGFSFKVDNRLPVIEY